MGNYKDDRRLAESFVESTVVVAGFWLICYECMGFESTLKEYYGTWLMFIMPAATWILYLCKTLKLWIKRKIRRYLKRKLKENKAC